LRLWCSCCATNCRLPAIIGFLFTGALAGPHGFGLIAGVHEVEILAEVGIVLLLFTIGIEFSIEELLRIKRQVLVGGALQVGLTIGVTYLCVSQLGLQRGTAIFVGFLVCLSSTAIVMRLYQESAVIDTSHGRLSLAVLIFQDIAIVPLMLFTPILAGTGGDPLPQLLELGLKALGVIALVFVASKWIVPHLFFILRWPAAASSFSSALRCFVLPSLG
jgi:CPA2 family monovalent cation:H+ antiporter-2